MKFCPECGAEVVPGRIYCSRCGYAAHGSDPAGSFLLFIATDAEGLFSGVNAVNN